MAQVHLKSLDPSLFTNSASLQQASCSVLINNTGNVHNLVQGDTWNLTLHAINNSVGGGNFGPPTRLYQFYFGTGASSPQIAIDISGGADTVAQQITEAINGIGEAYLSAIWTSGATFILVAGPYYVGTFGNAVQIQSLSGKITNENGTNLVGGQDSVWTLPGYFGLTTYGVKLDTTIVSQGVTANSVDVTPVFGALSSDLSFTSAACSFPAWAALGFGIPGGSTDFGTRPDFSNNPLTPQVSLGSIKGWLLQTLGNANGCQPTLNPSNLDINLHFVVLNESDVANTISTTSFFGVVYLGNQDVAIDQSPSSSTAFQVVTTDFGPNEGTTVTCTPYLNMSFDTVPTNSGGVASTTSSGLPTLAQQAQLIPDAPPASGEDFGLTVFGNPTNASVLTRLNPTEGGLVYQGAYNGIGAMVTNGDILQITNMSTPPISNGGFLLNLALTLNNAPSADETLFDYGYDGTNGIRIWIDSAQTLHFAWGTTIIHRATTLALGAAYCCSFFITSNTFLVMNVSRLDAFEAVGSVPMTNSAGFGTPAGSPIMSLLGNNDATGLATDVAVYGFSLWINNDPSEYLMAAYGEGTYPLGTYLPAALHHYWIVYFNSYSASPYAGSPSPPVDNWA